VWEHAERLEDDRERSRIDDERIGDARKQSEVEGHARFATVGGRQEPSSLQDSWRFTDPELLRCYLSPLRDRLYFRAAVKAASMGKVRRTILVGIALAAVGCSSPSSSPPSPSPSTPLTVYTAGDAGVALPTVINEVSPSYTSQALGARIQGSVLLSAVVLADGTVGDVTVLRSLDTTYGLDTQAVVAARKWLFKPGTKDGVAVAVKVTIEMTFTIR
jgi:TonB family protein